jgi:carbamoyltransferase
MNKEAKLKSLIKYSDDGFTLEKHDVQNIFSLNISHDSSVCYLKGGKVDWMLEEERLTHRKHDDYPLMSILKANNSVSRNSLVVYTALEVPIEEEQVKDTIDICLLLASKVMRKNHYKTKGFESQHHLSHASIGFYNSGFEDAAVLVVDGAGAIRGNGHEVESIYRASYPDNFELLHQRHVPLFIQKKDEEPLKDPTSGIGMAYAAASDYIGFNFTEAGKLMGLAPYGKENESIIPFVVGGEVNEDILFRVSNGVMLDYYDAILPPGKIDIYRLYNDHASRCVRDEDDGVKCGPGLSSPGHVRNPTKKYQLNCDIAYRMQKDFESYMIGLIKKAVDITGCKNVVISGGCALNCVANYEYLKHLPKGGKLFVEPICYDAGLSAGQAMLEYRQKTKSMEINPLKTLYLGPRETHIPPEDAYDITVSEVSELIEQGNFVAIFQGRSEQGPRALGNRSLLFDPRNPDAMTIVNKMKGRELWRPLAASVMLEHASTYFDMRSLEESPFMMYAMNAYEQYWDTIPGVLHIDKTCRIQTVTSEQNKHYYNLIKEFYKRTGVPMLLNTSFNLAGDTICETVDDVVDTLERSQLEYAYFPEYGKMLHITKNTSSNKRGIINYQVTENTNVV